MTHIRENIEGHHAGEALDILVTIEDEDVDTLDGVQASDLIGNAQEIEWVLLYEQEDPYDEAITTKTLDSGVDRDHVEANDNQFVVHVDGESSPGQGDGVTSGKGGKTLHHRTYLIDGGGNMGVVNTGDFEVDY